MPLGSITFPTAAMNYSIFAMLHLLIYSIIFCSIESINLFWNTCQNQPQTYRPTHKGKKAGRCRMEKLAQLALWPDQPTTVDLTSNIGKMSTPNVHDESKLQLCVLNTE